MYSIITTVTTKTDEVFVVNGDLVEMTSSLNSKDGNMSPTPGVIEQHASFKIYDRNNIFRDVIMVQTNDFFRGARVDFVGIIDGEEHSMGEYLIENIEVQLDSNEVIIECTDSTEKLSKILVSEVGLERRTVDRLLHIVFDNFTGEAWFYQDSRVQEVCEEIRTDSYINGVTAREILDSICYLAMLNIWKDGAYFVVGLSAAILNSEHTGIAPLDLTPSQFMKGAKFTLKKINQIDTVKFSIYSETSEVSTLDTRDITSVKVRGNTKSLPIRENGVLLSDGWTMYNKSCTSYWQNDITMSRGTAGVLMADVTFNITVSAPMTDLFVELSFSGVSKERNSSSNGDLSNFHDMSQRDSNYKLTWTSDDYKSLIEAASGNETSWSGNSNYVIYTNPDGINISPYVKQVVPAKGKYKEGETVLPPSAYFITEWTGYTTWYGYWSSSQYNGWRYERWRDYYRDTVGGDNAVNMWPSSFCTEDYSPVFMTKNNQRIQGLCKKLVPIKKEVVKIDTYHYTINLQVPVKYIYACFTRYNCVPFVFVEENRVVSGKMFYDLVSNIHSIVKGYSLVGASNDYAVSIADDPDDPDHIELTENAKNNSIFDVPSSTLIRDNTSCYFEEAWRDLIPRELLGCYRDGKYSLTIDVEGIWALKNNIRIDSVMRVKMLDGNYVSKVVNYTYGYRIAQGPKMDNPVMGRDYLFIFSQMEPLDSYWIYAKEELDIGFWIVNNDGTLTFSGRLKDMNPPASVVAISISTVRQYIQYYAQDEEGEYYAIGYQFYPTNGAISFIYDKNVMINNVNVPLDDNYNNELYEHENKRLNAPCSDLTAIEANNGYYVEKYLNFVNRSDIVFAVKNIERRFTKEGLVYSLGLVEDHTED